MGPYEDFDQCVRRNRDKENPRAYCGAIKRDTEDKAVNIDFLKGEKGHTRLGNVYRGPKGEIKVGVAPPNYIFLGTAYRNRKGRVQIQKAAGGTYDTSYASTFNTKKADRERRKTGAIPSASGIGGPVEENVGKMARYRVTLIDPNPKDNGDGMHKKYIEAGSKAGAAHHARKLYPNHEVHEIEDAESEKCAHLCTACVGRDVLKSKLISMLADWGGAEYPIAKILQSENLDDMTCEDIKEAVEKYSLVEADWSYDNLKIEKLAQEDDGTLVIAGHAQFTKDPSGEELDNDGEIVDIGSLKAAFADYMKNPIIRFMHGKDYIKHAIGRVIPEYVTKDGIVHKTAFDKFPYLVIKISNAPDTVSIRKKIEEGMLTGLSIGGKLLKKITDFNKKTGAKFPRVFVKSWLETSVVDMPSNKGAFFNVISKCAGIEKELKRNTHQQIDDWIRRRYGRKYFEESEGGKRALKFTEFGPADYIFKDVADWNLEANESRGEQEALKQEQEKKKRNKEKSSSSDLEKLWSHQSRPYLVYSKDGRFVSAYADAAEAERQAAQVGGVVKNKMSKEVNMSDVIYKFHEAREEMIEKASKRIPIPKEHLDEATNKYKTNRAIYQHLANKGYSNRQIADAFQVSHRTIWERTHDKKYSPREKVE